MREATEDPTTWIVERSASSVTYENVDGDRWVVDGVCNRCGGCEVGAVGRNLLWVGEPGTPGACVDLDYATRRDMPVRPEIVRTPGCSLTGRYL